MPEPKTIIAVLTPWKNTFRRWVRDKGQEGDEYIHVSTLEDCHGRVFEGIRYAHDAWELDQYNEIVEQVKLRIKDANKTI